MFNKFRKSKLSILIETFSIHFDFMNFDICRTLENSQERSTIESYVWILVFGGQLIRAYNKNVFRLFAIHSKVMAVEIWCAHLALYLLYQIHMEANFLNNFSYIGISLLLPYCQKINVKIKFSCCTIYIQFFFYYSFLYIVTNKIDTYPKCIVDFYNPFVVYFILTHISFQINGIQTHSTA